MLYARSPWCAEADPSMQDKYGQLEMQVSCESEYCSKEKLVEYIIMHTYLYQVSM